MNRLAALLATALHCAALAALLPSCVRVEVPQPAPPPVASEGGVVFVATSSDGTQACEHFYLGIGLKAAASGHVFDVAPGSPAERAFIREGDVIDNIFDFFPDTLPEGAAVMLRVWRAERLTVKTLRVARICTA